MDKKKRSSTAKLLSLLNKQIEQLEETPLWCKTGFLNVGGHMGDLSSGFASGAGRAVSIQERITTSGALGLTPLLQDLRKINREMTTLFRVVENVLTNKSNVTGYMDSVTDWALLVEQDAFLPSLVNQVKNTDTDTLELQTHGAMIDSLMRQIRLLIQEIISASQESSIRINNLSRRITADLETCRHGRLALKENVNATLRNMTKSVKRIEKSCKEMEANVEPVNAVLFEMVGAMQYDDITSQRTEHVIEILRQTAEKIADGENPEKSRRWAAVAMRITIDQMKEIDNDLSKAVKGLRENLNSVTKHSESQRKNITKTRRAGMSFRKDSADIAYHLSTLLRLPIFEDGLSSEVLRSLSQAENAVFQSKRALEMLGMTADRLEKLTGNLDARGNERAKLLNERIHELAKRIHKESKTQNREADQAADHLQKINEEHAEKVTPRLMQTNSLLRRFPLATGRMDTGNNTVLELMNESLREVQATSIQIVLLITELTFHKRVHEVFKPATEALQQIIHEIAGDLGKELEGDLGALLEEFADLNNLYTMDSERRVQDAALGIDSGDGEEEDDGIELF